MARTRTTFLRRRGDSAFQEIVAPALGAVGLITGLAFMVSHYSALTASDVAWINDLPWLLAVAGIAVTTIAPVTTPVTTAPAGGR